MTAVEELSFSDDGMSVDTAVEDRRVRVRFAGVADLGVRERLVALLRGVHARADSLRLPEVVADLSRLEFMNAACLRAFVGWIQELQELPPSRQYRIRFLSNRDLPWQRRSIAALKCFATELISIEAGA